MESEEYRSNHLLTGEEIASAYTDSDPAYKLTAIAKAQLAKDQKRINYIFKEIEKHLHGLEDLRQSWYQDLKKRMTG